MSFLGVPYAAAPVGELRFRRPRPRAGWFGVREAAAFGPCTPQYDLEKGSFYQREFYPTEKYADEDGLYLNIWTAAEDSEAGLPVFVWVHGGAFVEGSGSALQFRGDALAKRGLVVVTLNYRLGPFGFLAHPALTAREGSSGNYALWDQLAVLEWVRENIAAFGGDPENVTLAGQSAGSYCVGALMTSPLAEGLFRRVILQSGSVLGRSLPSLVEAEETGEAFAAGLGGRDALLSAPWQAVLAAGQQQRFGIIRDGVLLPEEPNVVFARGEQAKVDMLSCSCGDEGCIAPPDSRDAEHYKLLLKQAGDAGEALAAAFPVNRPEDAYRQLLKIRAAQTYAGMASLAQAQSGRGTQVWSACFCKELPGDGGIGPFHSAELVYEFGTLDSGWRPWEPSDYALSRDMTAYWANFCRSGNPNGPGLPLWAPFSPGEVMRLDVPCTMGAFLTPMERAAVHAP